MLTLTLSALLAVPGDPLVQPADEPDIVVEARKREEIEAQARSLVRALVATPVGGQLPRWHAPICPRVIGVRPEIAARVAGRIRAVAEEAGAPIAHKRCDPNFLVTFTDDASGLLARLSKRSPRAISAPNVRDRAKLVTGEAPVRWWFGAEVENADGRPLVGETAAGSTGMMMGVGGARDLPGNGDAMTADAWSSRLTGTYVRASLAEVSAIVDVTRATGKPLDAVSDYIAMVGLGAIRYLPGDAAAPSILRLFDADGGIVALTEWDRAYLKAVYRIRPNATAFSQRGQLVAEMTRELAP